MNGFQSQDKNNIKASISNSTPKQTKLEKIKRPIIIMISK